ncbi:MAG: hypothetical protein ABSF08_13265 [Candidatus Cybelea sp.]|jgi:hypothetical protein
MEQQKDSRLNFLKAGLLVGGAMYADPAAALARNGGRFFEPDGKYLLPPKTSISKFIPGSYLPGDTGEITLGDFAAIADLNATTLLKLSRRFSDVTLGDIGDIISYQVAQFGSSQTLFGDSSGQESIWSCCCCCTTVKIAL